uniref:(northern house mosquito) hypothetical protein n=1 Tax=Culex pipiens TaxID=7175 RepID=A0A8D8ITY2_CULPI
MCVSTINHYKKISKSLSVTVGQQLKLSKWKRQTNLHTHALTNTHTTKPTLHTSTHTYIIHTCGPLTKARHANIWCLTKQHSFNSKVRTHQLTSFCITITHSMETT